MFTLVSEMSFQATYIFISHEVQLDFGAHNHTISLGYMHVRKDFVFLAVSEDPRDHSSSSLGKDIPLGKMVGCEQFPLTLSETVHAK